jgi:hypothetical protein
MPNRLYHWRIRVKEAEREYQAVRIALDLLGNASAEEIHDLTTGREWNDLAAIEIYEAERNLDATYLIRMYSVFERAIDSFWRQMPGNTARRADGDVMLDDVGIAQSMDQSVIDAAQTVRGHRNHLVHRRIEDSAGFMTLAAASRDLLKYLESLPATWP